MCITYYDTPSSSLQLVRPIATGSARHSCRYSQVSPCGCGSCSSPTATSVEALSTQSVKSLIEPMAEVEGCIVPALCPVGHQVDGDDASAALAAALERSPLYLPEL